MNRGCANNVALRSIREAHTFLRRRTVARNSRDTQMYLLTKVHVPYVATAYAIREAIQVLRSAKNDKSRTRRTKYLWIGGNTRREYIIASFHIQKQRVVVSTRKIVKYSIVFLSGFKNEFLAALTYRFVRMKWRKE